MAINTTTSLLITINMYKYYFFLIDICEQIITWREKWELLRLSCFLYKLVEDLFKLFNAAEGFLYEGLRASFQKSNSS